MGTANLFFSCPMPRVSSPKTRCSVGLPMRKQGSTFLVLTLSKCTIVIWGGGGGRRFPRSLHRLLPPDHAKQEMDSSYVLPFPGLCMRQWVGRISGWLHQKWASEKDILSLLEFKMYVGKMLTNGASLVAPEAPKTRPSKSVDGFRQLGGQKTQSDTPACKWYQIRWD
ncbi:Uncharacterised protein r2_g1196 [Pycnogonum litorale]